MKILLAFLFKTSRSIVIAAILASIASGAVSSGLMALTHKALNSRASSAYLIVGFVTMCLVYPLSRVLSEVLLVYLSQKVIFDLRGKFMRQILATPLRTIEEIGSHRILAAMTDDVATLASGLSSVPNLWLQGSVLLSCLVYLAWLSLPLFMVVAVIVPLGIAGINGLFVFGVRHLARARKEQDMLLKHMQAATEDIMHFKLHSGRRDAFLRRLFDTSGSTYQRENVKGSAIFIAGSSAGVLIFFITIALFLFVAPHFLSVRPEVVTGYVLIMGFLMIPVSVITSLISNLSRANLALKSIQSLGLELVAEAVAGDGSTLPPAASGRGHTLDLIRVSHTYRSDDDASSFTLGPISLNFRAGEIVFITGGNGSGKTTLAKIITGLYAPESGQIRFNGEPVEQGNLERYRDHFSALFSSFLLFENLLGLEPQLDEQARDYLTQLRLDHKVQVKDGVLSTINLSRGQSKRLALLTALLENRPFYVFDEWAADQDPEFKSIFYDHLLPGLKSPEKTILVITHDDRYFHMADRLIKLDHGQVVFDSLNIQQEDRPATAHIGHG